MIFDILLQFNCMDTKSEHTKKKLYFFPFIWHQSLRNLPKPLKTMKPFHLVLMWDLWHLFMYKEKIKNEYKNWVFFISLVVRENLTFRAIALPLSYFRSRIYQTLFALPCLVYFTVKSHPWILITYGFWFIKSHEHG